MDTTAHSEGLKPLAGMLPPIEESEGVCDTHGSYTEKVYKIAGREIHQGCPACLLERSHKETQKKIETVRNSARQGRAEAMLNRSGIPPRYTGATFDNFILAPSGGDRNNQEAALMECKSFAENFQKVLEFGGNLLLVGKSGTGKTRLACTISNVVTSQGYSSLFIGAPAIVRRIMGARYSASGVSPEDVLEELAGLDLLIIDELESFYGEGAREIIIDVINARYEQRRPIIAITNLGVDELNEKLSLRSVDRLADDNGRKITFSWPSYRRKVASLTPPWMSHGQ